MRGNYMGLYERFLTKENFELAYSRIKHAPNNAYKYFYKKDVEVFGLFLGQNINQLISEIESHKYEPQPVCRYYIPKKNYLTRPISLLNFIDLLVYQAIANVLLNEFAEGFAVDDNRRVFANIINKEESSKYFQFSNWKNQWKCYRQKIEKIYKEGFTWVADFDIASFYDLIDQEILLNLLRDREIDEELVALLGRGLSQWTLSTLDSDKKKKRCGIPQGPECSGFFAEIYLRQIDARIIKNVKGVNYFRYADDIKIMAKTESECKMAVALLDYYCKDMCLIAQAGKIGVKFLDDKSIHQYINASGLKLSNISIEAKTEGRLKDSTHNKLKKKLNKVFEPDNSLYLDKTILKFAFFKLNEDEEIKELILANWELLYLTFEGPIYYLNKYYSTDEKVLAKIREVLLSDDVLFQYNKAIIYDIFKSLPLYEDVYENLTKNKGERFWVVKYFAIKWLSRLGQYELIKYILSDGSNYFLDREILLVDISNAKTEIAKKQIAKQYYAKDSMLSLCAFYTYQIYADLSEDDTSDYILNILQLNRSDYIRDYFKEKYKIYKKTSKKFVDLIKRDFALYNEAVNELMRFEDAKAGSYPETALMSLDLFHNVLVDAIFGKENGDFGATIERMKSSCPVAYNSFKMIHDERNQRTVAHYKDKSSAIRKVITKNELNQLLVKAKLEDAYTEICEYYN